MVCRMGRCRALQSEPANLSTKRGHGQIQVDNLENTLRRSRGAVRHRSGATRRPRGRPWRPPECPATAMDGFRRRSPGRGAGRGLICFRPQPTREAVGPRLRALLLLTPTSAPTCRAAADHLRPPICTVTPSLDKQDPRRNEVEGESCGLKITHITADAHHARPRNCRHRAPAKASALPPLLLFNIHFFPDGPVRKGSAPCRPYHRITQGLAPLSWRIPVTSTPVTSMQQALAPLSWRIPENSQPSDTGQTAGTGGTHRQTTDTSTPSSHTGKQGTL